MLGERNKNMKSVHKSYIMRAQSTLGMPYMIEKLKKLGLSSYESRAYLALLKLGNAVADEIAINAKIPMGRIYGVLSNLEEVHLVLIQATRPKRYVPAEPATALKWLSKNKLDALKDKMAEIEILVNDLMSEVSGIRTRKLLKV